jgi:hypothetical protein
MYRVVKEKGNGVNIFVENTESKKSLNIGRLSMEMIKILEEAGFTFGTSDGEVAMKDEWSLEVNTDTKDKLTRLAMKMSKPIRDQSKKSEHKSAAPDAVPDLFELIFG